MRTETVFPSYAQRVLVLLLVALPLLAAVRAFGHVGDERYGVTHFLFTYEYGFHRRALLGEILSWFLSPNYTILRIVGFAGSVAAILFAYAFFAKELFADFEKRAFAVFLLVGPAFAPHFARMLGPDSVSIILAIIALMALRWRPSDFMLLVFVTPLVIISLLIHEVFIATLYPLIFLIILFLWDRKKIGTVFLLSHLCIVIFSLLTILYFGDFDIDPYAYAQIVQSRSGYDPAIEAFEALSRSISEQFIFVRGEYTLGGILSIIISLGVSSPYIFAVTALAVFATRAVAMSGWQTILAMVILISPIALVIIGHDVMRWVSFACINVSLWAAFIYRMDHAAVGPTVRKAVRSEWFFVVFLWCLGIGAYQRTWGIVILENLTGWLLGT